MFISDKLGFRPKLVIRNKEVHSYNSLRGNSIC
jgi:hypothetical protein